MSKIIVTIKERQNYRAMRFCWRCKQVFKPGDRVIRLTQRQRPKSYHLACYETMGY